MTDAGQDMRFARWGLYVALGLLAAAALAFITGVVLGIDIRVRGLNLIFAVFLLSLALAFFASLYAGLVGTLSLWSDARTREVKGVAIAVAGFALAVAVVGFVLAVKVTASMAPH